MDFKKIGVVIADDMEFLPLVELVTPLGYEKGEINSYETISFSAGSKEVTAIKCRIGKVNAATATAMLIDKIQPDCIMNIGLSGGVKGVNRGTVFAGSSFTECDFDLGALGRPLGVKPGQEYVYEADKALLDAIPQEMGIRLLKCGTGDYFLTKDSQKEEYHKLFGINTFDMETGAIASVCHCCDVPFLSIRKVSDDSEDSAAEDYKKMNALAETALADILLEVLKNL
ncbi:MAG: 5'-methylthioadenosine/S-adenosylhomocysteine nucleosidase [Clostridia bacterium]|nr:5'-methylthioadenosine/S-adenosylhomocysteine nucleosidase [Clostridia bacterium]